MKLTYIMPLLASLTIATRTPEESEFTSLSESSVSTVITPTTSTGVAAPSLVVRKPLLNIDSSILKIVGDSILTTLATKLAASEPTKLAAIAPAITDSSSALVPTLVERELRRPEDKVRIFYMLALLPYPRLHLLLLEILSHSQLIESNRAASLQA